jgi:Uma2 family endonuclease
VRRLLPYSAVVGNPGAKSSKPATYADIEALPPHLIGEILDGELVASPRPAPRHAQASSNLGVLLGNPFGFGRGGPGGWRIVDEPESHLHRDVVVPDIAGWRLERMPALPSTAYFELPPDWACEVLSESTRRRDRVQKLSIYAREKVTHVWLIDPDAQTLEVFRLDGARWLLVGTWSGTDKVRAEPFDALELDLALLWPA